MRPKNFPRPFSSNGGKAHTRLYMLLDGSFNPSQGHSPPLDQASPCPNFASGWERKGPILSQSRALTIVSYVQVLAVNGV